MRPAEAARRAHIAGAAQQQPSLQDMLAMQPVSSVRLHQVTQIVPKPASPLERSDHDVVFGELELHLITLGDPMRQILPLTLEAAEHIHQQLGGAIERARTRRQSVSDLMGPQPVAGPDDPTPEADA